MPTSFAILVWNNKSRHGSVFPHNPRICSQKTIINGKNLPYNLWVTPNWSVYARECNPQKTTNFWEKRLKHLKRHVNTQFSQTPNFFWEFEFPGILTLLFRTSPLCENSNIRFHGLKFWPLALYTTSQTWVLTWLFANLISEYNCSIPWNQQFFRFFFVAKALLYFYDLSWFSCSFAGFSPEKRARPSDDPLRVTERPSRRWDVTPRFRPPQLWKKRWRRVTVGIMISSLKDMGKNLKLLGSPSYHPF